MVAYLTRFPLQHMTQGRRAWLRNSHLVHFATAILCSCVFPYADLLPKNGRDQVCPILRTRLEGTLKEGGWQGRWRRVFTAAFLLFGCFSSFVGVFSCFFSFFVCLFVFFLSSHLLGVFFSIFSPLICAPPPSPLPSLFSFSPLHFFFTSLFFSFPFFPPSVL